VTASDYIDWNAPQAHADSIAATGAPLIIAPNQLDAVSGLVIAGGGNDIRATLPVSQVSYGFQCAVKTNGAPTVPFIQFQFAWIDSGTSEVVDTDTFTVPASNNLNAFQAKAHGPCKANQVQVTITNLDPAVGVTVGFGLNQTSQPYTTDEITWPLFGLLLPSVPGFTLASLAADEAVLGFVDNLAIGAGSSSTFLFAPWDGLISVAYELSAGAAAALQIRVRPQPDTSYAAHNILGSTGTPPSVYQFAGCRAPLRVVLANTSGAGITVSMSLVRVRA